MIRLKIRIDDRRCADGAAVSWVCAAGHAGFAPKGQDIVCAAVSTAMDFLLRASRCLGIEAEGGPDAGDGLKVAMRGPEGEMLAKAAAQQMLDLERQYPENVRVEVSGICCSVSAAKGATAAHGCA